MSSLSRELVLLILQFLEEERYMESVHRLEQESGVFFNMKYFDEKVLAGEWDEVERYLSGFTKLDDNRYSMKIFFEIRKQKYLEALDRNEKGKAVQILNSDLKVFAAFNDDLFKEITLLLTLDNFRENEQLSKYGDAKTARGTMLLELKKLIEANPYFREKLVFPTLKASRLRTLVNQSLNWQHQLCKSPRSNPDIKTLFTDHTCNATNSARATPVSIASATTPKATTSYMPLGAHGPSQPAATTSNANPLAGWMANAAALSSVQSVAVGVSPLSVTANQVSPLKRPRSPPHSIGMTGDQNNDHDHLIKRLRSSVHPVDEVPFPTPLPQPAWSLEDLPRVVNCTLNQGSKVTSMDFHPSHHTVLLVGSGSGEITLWDIRLREKLISKPFKILDIGACTPQFQAVVAKDSPISSARVTWSPDGSLIGVAFTEHLIQLHAYQAPNELHQLLEIDAHVGGINDIAFSYPKKQLCVISCGVDKQIKVWDLKGQMLYVFEGHAAPVYSVCPHHKDNIQFFFSTSVDGKIKAWLYDTGGSRVDYDAPGNWCTTMLYSADGSRLFSCGTSRDGDSYLVEWNETEGTIRRTYSGFQKKSTGVVQFDTAKNHFLAAGDDNQIKFWDVDNVAMLASTDAEGGLPNLPRLRFNKEGNLLAVTTVENGLKILANADGLKSLQGFGGRSFEATRSEYEGTSTKVLGVHMTAPVPPSTGKMDPVDRNSPAEPFTNLNGADHTIKSIDKSNVLEELPDKDKPGELAEILNVQQCRVVSMPESTDPTSKVARLLYTNSGVGLLALLSNAVQRLWKWSRNEQNPSGKATASVVPQHWRPNSGLLMTNDVSNKNPEDAVPCIALSKNDSYVMSACGGKVSLFNLMSFKVMTTFMPTPPASTFLAFHPKDNNIIAIGMEDSTIHIYNVRVDEVSVKLKGHAKHITGLAFSTNLNILVSSGADAQIFVWTTDSWEKKASVALQLPPGKIAIGDTKVQFDSNQTRLLVVHESQLAIYDAFKVDLIHQWLPQGVLSAPISCASYSCDSHLVYASFCDGNIGVFGADNLGLRCRIAPLAYLCSTISSSNPPAHPVVLAAHPQEPHQFAVGLTTGEVKVVEPVGSDGKWGAAAVVNNAMPNSRAAASSATSNNPSAVEQVQT